MKFARWGGGLMLGLWLWAEQPVLAEPYVADPTFLALSRKGRPKDISRGGGKRSGCAHLLQGKQELMALVPEVELGGLSATATPTFWVYVPYVSGEPLDAVLAVRRAGDFRAKPVQQVAVRLGRSGVVGVRLPSAIEAGVLMEWSLTVRCDLARPDRNPFVRGLVVVKPDEVLVGRLAGGSVAERVAGYGRSGYWYDALALVAEANGGEERSQLLRLAGLRY